MQMIRRNASSKEMKKNSKVVKRMSHTMCFDETMTSVNWKKVRRICDFGYQFMPKAKGIRFKKMNLNGVSAILSSPKELLSDGIVLYIHGGGFVSGSSRATKGYSSMLAREIGCRVISIDYALVPEHPYPEGLNDVFTAYRSIQTLFPASKIAVTGESSGGNLCFALTIRCLDSHIQPPACIVSHSGVFDFSGYQKRDYEIDDFTVKQGMYSAMKTLYGNGCDMRIPEISPLFYDDISKFPPAVFTCDSKETVKVDSFAMYERYREAGVMAILYEYKNTFHAFATIGTMSPETTKLLKENGEFIRRYID